MCEVVNSTLWKSLRVGLSKYERAKLLRELRKAVSDHPRGVSLHVTDLYNAFVWEDSPQGHNFWYRERTAHRVRERGLNK